MLTYFILTVIFPYFQNAMHIPILEDFSIALVQKHQSHAGSYYPFRLTDYTVI